MDTITTEVPTSEGDVMVTTKARAFFIFNRPHTSVMPVGLSRFGMKLGFQAWYNTAEPPVLEDLHWFFVEEIAGGNFKSMLANAKVGVPETRG